MHVAITIFGVLFLAVICLMVALWCILCYRIGVWMAGGSSTASRAQRADYRDRPKPVASVPAAAPPRRRSKRSSGIGMILFLLLVGLSIIGIRNLTVARQRHHRPAPAAQAKAAENKNPNWTVVKQGETEKDAEQLAMDDAHDTVVAYVERNLSGPKWVPSRDYVVRHMVQSNTHEEAGEFAGLGRVQKVTLRVELKPEETRDILRRGRMWFLIKALAAAVLLLATISIYIRLDECSKGYYTGWLRLTAAGIVAAVIFGLFQAGMIAMPTRLESLSFLTSAAADSSQAP